MKDYYSNCLIEAIRAKIKYRNQVKLIIIPSNKNEASTPHFMWHDLVDNSIYDFHNSKWLPYWWQGFFFKGYVRIRPYAVYERWLKTMKWDDEAKENEHDGE